MDLGRVLVFSAILSIGKSDTLDFEFYEGWSFWVVLCECAAASQFSLNLFDAGQAGL